MMLTLRFVGGICSKCDTEMSINLQVFMVFLYLARHVERKLGPTVIEWTQSGRFVLRILRLGSLKLLKTNIVQKRKMGFGI